MEALLAGKCGRRGLQTCRSWSLGMICGSHVSCQASLTWRLTSFSKCLRQVSIVEDDTQFQHTEKSRSIYCFTLPGLSCLPFAETMRTAQKHPECYEPGPTTHFFFSLSSGSLTAISFQNALSDVLELESSVSLQAVFVLASRLPSRLPLQLPLQLLFLVSRPSVTR